jgi:hypothetical protein
MFSTQDIVTAIIVGLTVGGLIGAMTYEYLVAEQLRRRIHKDRSRLICNRIRQYGRQHSPYNNTGRPW